MKSILFVHIACVILAFAGFVLRGIWMIRDSPLLHATWVKVVPHINDTLLLAAGITLALQVRQYPIMNGWLTAKTFGLAAYILLGTVALKRGKTKRIRIICWIGGLTVFGYIVAVAISRDPIPFAGLAGLH